ncbi:DAHP synthetase, putative [Eimeria praecox]|uniref:Phospho-2-dehydro-3-deoxyheptonate aldolase n=1 Tax=Eimeria praecox TaxID=51316 RepID=U6H0P2_9EIME|nr:DAHP synthetase, putative [Eimeria praecox]
MKGPLGAPFEACYGPLGGPLGAPSGTAWGRPFKRPWGPIQGPPLGAPLGGPLALGGSLRGLPVAQDPFIDVSSYRIAEVYRQLEALPPLVSAGEVECLLSLLAEAQQGEAFLLQGGPCAERFCCCREETLRSTTGLLLQLGALIEALIEKPVFLIGRIAGQYAKPR